MQTLQGQHLAGGAVRLRTERPVCQSLVPAGRVVAIVALASKATALEMREWLADAHLLGDDELTDEEVAHRVKVFSHLDVEDCAWCDINSHRQELLHLEASLVAS